jgi:hypothetical protein
MQDRFVLSRPRWTRLLAGALVAALVFGAPPDAAAQTTTGTLRGYVRGPGGAPVTDAQVGARDVETNQTRGATTNAAGFYNIGGLRPSTYEVTVRRIGFEPQTRTVRVQIGQTLDINFQVGETAVTLEAVTVVAAPAREETRTSEVATNVTEEQIEDLPTPGRNFLDLATLAPGTRVDPDRLEGSGKKFAAGAQSADQINVFVDGASYKNEIIQGGVAGQDASRGNPFPRNALQEFRITTTNFKAEYQKASSAIISAITKSGTNEWEGSAFLDFLNEKFVANDTFANVRRGADPNFEKQRLDRYLGGVSVGGPLVRDKLFFFGSYETNIQNRDGVTRFNGDAATWPSAITAANNEVNTSPFRSHLGFAKLTYHPSERQTFEFTGDLRRETDKRRFGGQFGGVDEAFSTGEDFRNTVATGRVKHTFFGSSWVNEAQASYQWYQWKTDPFNPDLPELEYQGIGRIGGRGSSQDLTQNRLSLRDDFTYSGFEWAGTHVLKAGLNYDLAHYDLTKRFNENPVFIFNAGNGFAFPVEARFGAGDPSVTQDNGQFGLYLQDDWSPIPRLTINAGVRWDYEAGMYNRDYVMPQAQRDSLTAYRDQLFIDIDPDRYFTDGNDREAFLGAWQPRLGFSFALDDQNRTVLFGGWGIFYDRVIFNATIDEQYNLQHPTYNFRFGTTDDPANNVIAWDDSYFSREGLQSILASGRVPPGEVFLLPNDLKPPKSDQWSIGVRQDFGSWNASATYNQTRSFNGFTYEWANHDLNPDGTCCIFRDFLVPAYRNVLVGRNDVRTWYDAIFFTLDRPYRPLSRWNWGAGLAWTYTINQEAEGGDLFSFPNVRNQPRRPLNDWEKHRFVINALTDVPYAWGIQFSTLITLGTGRRFNRNDVIVETDPANPGNFIVRSIVDRGAANPEKRDFLIPNAFAFRNVDIRFRKDFPAVGGNRIGVTLDVFNVFNFNNFGCFNEAFGIVQDVSGTPTRVENPDFGRPGCIIADPRRAQIGLSYDFGRSAAGTGGR